MLTLGINKKSGMDWEIEELITQSSLDILKEIKTKGKIICNMKQIPFFLKVLRESMVTDTQATWESNKQHSQKMRGLKTDAAKWMDVLEEGELACNCYGCQWIPSSQHL